MSRENLTQAGSFITKTLSAIVITCALAAVQSAPAAAQTASKLDCKGCIKSKQIENGKIKGKDLKDEAVDNDKIEDGAVTGSKIEDGAISMSKLGSDVTALGMSGITSVPPSAFVPVESDDDYGNLLGVAIFNQNNDDGVFCASAAVPLPHGAVVNRVEAVVTDNSALENMDIFLVSFDGSDPASPPVNMATISSSGFSLVPTTLSTSSITSPTVDLETGFYYVGICPPVDTALHGVRVYY